MMVRFVAAAALVLSGFSADLGAASRNVPRVLRLRSAAALVQDEHTGQLLFAKRTDVAMPIASITKLMTAMVVLNAGLDMEQTITIEKADEDTLRHSTSHLPVGTRLTRRQALLLALMASENRAAYALGRTYPGGVSTLVAAMNERARILGLTETKFVDPTGLNDQNVSSAQDLSRLVEAAGRYPQIAAFSTQTECTIQRGRRRLHFVNTNPLVRNPHWQIGLSKTGYIEEGGRCLVMQTRVGQRSLLIVLLNSNGKHSHFEDAVRIRQWLESSQATGRAEQKARPLEGFPNTPRLMARTR